MRDTKPHDAPADHGSAMVITLMVLALVTALSTTVAVVTVNNLQGSRRAQQAGAALGAADAGIAQAMSYLRNNGVRRLACTNASPPPAACSLPWGSSAPTHVTLPGNSGQAYSVWIEAVLPFPANDPGKYRIHSTGTAAGPASREVVTEVSVSTIDVPMGIFARSVNGAGNGSVSRQSIFTTGCVFKRSHLNISGIDVAYGIQAGVHSSQIITDTNSGNRDCSPDNKAIHKSGPCNNSYPYDQDKLGGNLSSASGCSTVQSSTPQYYGPKDFDGDGSYDVHGSFIRDDASLYELFGIRTPALTQSQIDQIRAIAQSQGNYWTSATGWTSPDETNAVMFFDLNGSSSRLVDLKDITGFSRAPNMSATDPGCASKSLIIVVDGGNVRLNGNQRLAASLFLLSGDPYGKVDKANGGADFIGTLYADTFTLSGNADISLDPCFMANVSPALLDFSQGNYRELDR
jgi:hypothetical protein